MKKLQQTTFLAFLLCTLLVNTSFAQKRGGKGTSKIVELKSFTLSKAAYNAQQKKRTLKLKLNILRNGRVVAVEGYKMAITGDKKRIYVIPKDGDFHTFSQIDMRKNPDGSESWCICPQYPDDCKINGLDCNGTCGCGIVELAPPNDDVREYETPGGGYF